MTHPTITPYYSDLNTSNEIANTLSNVAPCERLRLCIDIDKEQYNQDLFSSSGSGDFDSNLNYIGAAILGTMPSVDQTFFAAQTQVIENTDTNYKACFDFRVTDSYAGSTFFVIFETLFRVDGVTERSWYKFQIQVNDYTNALNIVSVKDENGNLLDGAICADKVNEVCIELSPDVAGLDIIAIISTETHLHEYNVISSDDLEKLTTTLVNSLSETELKINPKLYPIGESCIKLIQKAKDTVIVMPTCESIELTWELTVIQCNDTQAQLQIRYIIDSVVDVASSSATGSFSFAGNSSAIGVFSNSGTSGGVFFDIMIALDDGCTYQSGITLSYDCADQSTQTVTNTVQPN